MNAQQALLQIQSAGFTVLATGGSLTVAPASRLTDAQRQFVRQHKPALLRLLAAQRTPEVTDARRPVLAWLHWTGENSQPIINEILERCRTDPEALVYYLERAQEVPQTGDNNADDGPVSCAGCRHFHPDRINPAQGIGACLAGAGQHGRPPYPHAIRWCRAFQEGGQ